MKTLKKIGIGCGSLVIIAILCIAVIAIVINAKKNKYDKIVFPFIEEALPVLATWEAEQFEKYWIDEILENADQEQLKRLFKTYSKLGKLKTYEDPIFLQVGTSTDLEYSSYVNYQMTCEFENGKALLSWTFVPINKGKIKVWSLHINSDVFLEPLE